MRLLRALLWLPIVPSTTLVAQTGNWSRVDRWLELGHPDSAEAVVADALRRNPSDPVAMCYRGRLLLARGEYEDASDRLEEALEGRPNDAACRYWLGRAYHERMEHSGMIGKARYARRAIRAFEDAVRLDPEHVDARVWLINYLWQAPGIVGGDREEATRHLDQLGRRDRLLSYELQGTLWWEDEEYRLAAQAYGEILRLDSTHTEARYMLGRIAQEAQDWSAAFRWFAAAVERDSMDLRSQYQLGRTGVLSGRHRDRSIEAFVFYLRHGPADGGPSLAAAHWRRGMIYERSGRTADARADYERAIQLDPKLEQAREALDRLTDGRGSP